MFNRTTAIILVAALAVASGLWGVQHWMLRSEHARPQLQAVKLFDQPRVLPSFSLQQSDHTPLIPGELKGHWTLVFLGFTHCPDVCPTTLNDLSLALDRLGDKRNRVGIVFITVDPERDTPEALKSYVASFDAPVTALTGTSEQVAQAEKAYRVYSAKHPTGDGNYDMDHSAVIYVMDPQGRFTATFTPDTGADAVAERMQKLLS